MSQGGIKTMNYRTQIAIYAGGAIAGVLARKLMKPTFSFRGQSVLISGGSRGLGLILARLFAEEGAHLTLVARHRESLEAAEQELLGTGATVQVIACDIREREQATDAVERSVRRYGSIDVLVNNAGVIEVGPWDAMTLTDFQDAMATHMWGPLYLSLAAIEHMRRKHAGRIVNISSIGGKIAVPHLMPYCASKFALTGLSDSMRAELRQYGIHVTTVCPGLMRTGSHVNARFKGRAKDEFTWFSLMAGLPVFSINADRAARQIVDAVRRGRSELIITTQARMAVLANALAPNLVAFGMRLMNSLLPAASSASSLEPLPDGEGTDGWDSTSRWSPSVLTRLADQAIEQNNEYRTAS